MQSHCEVREKNREMSSRLGAQHCATVRAAKLALFDNRLDISIVITTIPTSLRPPEGLGVRLASAGPFLFPRRRRDAQARDARVRRAPTFVPAMRAAIAIALPAIAGASCAPGADADHGRETITSSHASSEPAAGDPLEASARSSCPGLHPFAPGVGVDRAAQCVALDGTVVLTRGFLEQLVCTPSTRVHESLIAIDAAPRSVHAALLLVGLEPGAPGRWQEVPDGSGAWGVDRVRPTGPRVDVAVEWVDEAGASREVPLLDWVRRVDASGDPDAAPASGDGAALAGHLVFAGSRIRPNTPSMGEGEHYVADLTGSVVGLVTFGDEVIAYDEVIADKVDVDPAAWVAWTERMPPEGTRVTVLIRAHGSGR
jgi:hypothetical protein